MILRHLRVPTRVLLLFILETADLLRPRSLTLGHPTSLDRIHHGREATLYLRAELELIGGRDGVLLVRGRRIEGSTALRSDRARRGIRLHFFFFWRRGAQLIRNAVCHRGG